jgi:hypothetical protein
MKINDQRKRELRDAFMDVATYYGAYRLVNAQSGRAFVGTYTNMKNGELRLRMQLDDGRHACRELQEDYTRLGRDAFIYEELCSKDASKVVDVRHECKHLQEEYLAQQTADTYN